MTNGFWNSGGSGLIGALGSLGSAGLGIISANHQSGKAFGRMLQAMDYQAKLNYKYGRLTAQNSPSWNRQGLETAGYNPMLAVQNATSGVNSSWTSQGGYQQDQATDAITNGISNGTDFANMLNQTKQTESNVKLNDAQARGAIADAIGKETHNKYLDSREQKELGKLDAETAQLNADANHKTAMIDAIDKNIELQRELGYLQSMTGISVANIGSNATKYAADKSYEGITYNTDESTNQSGTNANKVLAGDIAKSLVGAGLAIFVGNKIKLIKPVGDLIKVIPKNILIK